MLLQQNSNFLIKAKNTDTKSIQHGFNRDRVERTFLLSCFVFVKRPVTDRMDDNAEFSIFHYGRAVEAECPNCGDVQIPSTGFTNISCPKCNGVLSVNNNSHHSQVFRSSDHREGNLLPQDDKAEMNKETQAGIRTPSPPSTPTEDPSIQSLTTSFLQVSTENTASGIPLQEGFDESLTLSCPPSLERVQKRFGKLSKTPSEGHNDDVLDICHTCGKYSEHCSYSLITDSMLSECRKISLI